MLILLFSPRSCSTGCPGSRQSPWTHWLLVASPRYWSVPHRRPKWHRPEWHFRLLDLRKPSLGEWSISSSLQRTSPTDPDPIPWSPDRHPIGMWKAGLGRNWKEKRKQLIFQLIRNFRNWNDQRNPKRKHILFNCFMSRNVSSLWQPTAAEKKCSKG